MFMRNDKQLNKLLEGVISIFSARRVPQENRKVDAMLSVLLVYETSTPSSVVTKRYVLRSQRIIRKLIVRASPPPPKPYIINNAH